MAFSLTLSPVRIRKRDFEQIGGAGGVVGILRDQARRMERDLQGNRANIPIRTGRLRRSMRVRVDGRQVIRVTVLSNVDYAIYVERLPTRINSWWRRIGRPRLTKAIARAVEQARRAAERDAA